MGGQPPRRPGRPPADEIGAGERRGQILAAAVELFARRGYAAVSLGEIAAAVGVTKAALYHHFPNKQALYAEIMRDVLHRIGESIRATAREPGPVAAKLRHLAMVAIVWVQDDADMDAMLRDADEQLGPEQRREIDAAHRALMAALTGVMRDGIARGELRPGDPHLLAHAFWSLLGGFTGRAGSEAGFQGRPDVAAAVADLFLGGAGASDREPPD